MNSSGIVLSFRQLGIAFGIATLGIGISPASLFAQNSAAKNDVVAALTKMAKAGVSLSGAIEEERPENNAGPMGGIIMVGDNNNGATKTFLGEIEIVTTKDSDVSMVSVLDVPGIKVFANGDDHLCVQATTNGPFNTATLPTEVSKLCSWNDLADAVKSATEIEVHQKGKSTEVVVALAPEYFPTPSPTQSAQGGPVAIQIAGPSFAPTIHSIDVTFKLSESKEITDIEYSVQYNDPLQAIFGGLAVNVMAGEQVEAQGGVVVAEEALTPVENTTNEVGDTEKRIAPAKVGDATVYEVVTTPKAAIAPAAVAPAKDEPAAVPAAPVPLAVPALPAVPAMPLRAAPIAIDIAMPVQAPAAPGQVVVFGPAGANGMSGTSLGKLVVYDFHVESAPSQRATAFITEAKKLLKNSK